MLFSVIIPVYNVAPYLRACLDSVIASVEYLEKNNTTVQPSTEIICIDDGSTDGSSAILDEYAEKVRNSAIPNSSFLLPRFLVVHQPNRGVSAARNAALKIAQGDYICFVDADDSVDEGWLDEYRNGIEATHPDLIRAPLDSWREAEWSPSSFVDRGYPWAYCVRRAIANRAEFPVGVVLGEDAIYCLRLLPYVDKVVHLKCSKYNHRVDSGTAMFRPLSSSAALAHARALRLTVEELDRESVNVDIVSRMIAANFGHWISVHKDVDCRKQLKEELLWFSRNGCLRFQKLDRHDKLPLWLYLHFGLLWLANSVNLMQGLFVVFKRTFGCK